MNVAEYLEQRFGTAQLKIDEAQGVVGIGQNYVGMYEDDLRGRSEGIDLIWQEHARPDDRDVFTGMPIESNCGKDCRRVIDAAAAFLELCPDANDNPHSRWAVHVNVFRVIEHAVTQCRILITG